MMIRYVGRQDSSTPSYQSTRDGKVKDGTDAAHANNRHGKVLYSRKDPPKAGELIFNSKIAKVENKHLLSSPASQLLVKEPDWPFHKASEAKLYFVHSGKAGGKSLYKRSFVHESRLRLPCRMFNVTPNDVDDENCFSPDENDPKTFDSLLSKRLYGHFHMANPRYSEEWKTWLRDNTNLLLVTVRDPIDRITSAFNYHYQELITGKNFKVKKRYQRSNIGAKIYMECFADIQALARAMGPKRSTSTTPFCRKLGREFLEGKLVPTPGAHFHYNYHYYANWTWVNQKLVAVLRTESLWEDVARIEELLGGDQKPFLTAENQERVTHGSENFNLTTGVNQKDTFFLCCVLRKELQVYHDLVLAAVNLKGNEKMETLRQAMNHCGIKDEVSSPPVIAGWRWDDWHHRNCSVQDED
uniref:Sulfotransferase domain-containing protein n=1 Tax=Amphora coffeiformis TaxID=265554 RepID=A0A7S3L3V6_9STRA